MGVLKTEVYRARLSGHFVVIDGKRPSQHSKLDQALRAAGFRPDPFHILWEFGVDR